jgi:hypothetical protein
MYEYCKLLWVAVLMDVIETRCSAFFQIQEGLFTFGLFSVQQV